MALIIDIIEEIIEIVVDIIVIIVELVEAVIVFVVQLLGYDDTTETIEYFQVHNFPFFNDVDSLNPLLNTIQKAIISDSDIASELIYASAFRSYKGDIQDFLAYIKNGNYIEDFPLIESYISYPDYDELTPIIDTLVGSPTTVENAYTKALSQTYWISYWLQENKGYSYEYNTLVLGTSVVVTVTAGSATTSSSVHYEVNIIEVCATSDSVSSLSPSPGISESTSAGSTSSSYSINSSVNVIDTVPLGDAVTINPLQEVNIDFATIVYNSGTADYSVDVYDAGGVYTTLPYTIPSMPTGLHYIALYYVTSIPLVTYLFIYKVGEGTYPTLDNPLSVINIDSTDLLAIPAIPLRLNNVNYTSRPAAEVTKIEELCALVSLDAPAILDSIVNDPAAPAAGDLDHLYINFGVRLWDTSQTGLTYLFLVCENLFPTQAVTKGIYDSTTAGDTKPTNNVIITTDDYKSLFQFNYISYEFTTLAVIDANSGSAENGYYYSDMSKFDSLGILKYSYYTSSGKGTYNVGYKADSLTEVANFLTGSGTVNPGVTSGEATNWLQVTTRMNYNNPTPVLYDADDTVSSLEYLTGDLVYEDNGSGELRHVLSASEATTSGQSITYYRIIPSGLEAYTMKAPIGSLRVVDGESGKFKLVKFNLGNRDDLMLPFIYNFIEDLSNKDVTQLYLSGTHASMYVAHYEVIVQRTGGFGGLFLIILVILIIIVMVYTGGAGGALFGNLMATMASSVVGTTAAAVTWETVLVNILVKYAISTLIQKAATTIFGEDSVFGQVVGIVVSAVVLSGFSYDSAAGVSISYENLSLENMIDDWSWTDTFKVTAQGMQLAGSVMERIASDNMSDLLIEKEALDKRNSARLLDLSDKETVLRELQEALFAKQDAAKDVAYTLLDVHYKASVGFMTAEQYFMYYDNTTIILQHDLDHEDFFNRKITNPSAFV